MASDRLAWTWSQFMGSTAFTLPGGEPLPRLEHPAFHGALRHAQDLRRLPVAETEDLDQQQGLPEFGGQAVHRGLHLRARLGRRRRRRLGERPSEPVTSLTTSDRIDPGVPCHPEDPARELAAEPE